MNKSGRIIVVVTTLLCLATLTPAAQAQELPPAGGIVPEMNAPRDLPEVPPLMRPVPSAPPTGEFVVIPTALPVASFQLVGFTEETFAGTRGVLNHALACQRSFANSRLCTVDEIRRTVVVPPSPRSGAAWVDAPNNDAPLVRPFRVDEESANCRGWRSSSAGDFGVAIDLEGNYGALVRSSCDQELVLACCAMLQP